jgi:hypothetical protein
MLLRQLSSDPKRIGMTRKDKCTILKREEETNAEEKASGASLCFSVRGVSVPIHAIFISPVG